MAWFWNSSLQDLCLEGCRPLINGAGYDINEAVLVCPAPLQRLHHLAAELESGTAPQAHQSLLVNIWQPTDRLDVKWQDYNHILMVAGGIAVRGCMLVWRDACI